MNELRALTIREPFASAIVMGIKTVENRVQPFPSTIPLPATIAIHAGSDDSTICDDIDSLADSHPLIANAFNNPKCRPCVIGSDYFYSQTIVGLVDVIACVDISDLIDGQNEITDESAFRERFAGFSCDSIIPDAGHTDWAQGPYCMVLANPRRFKNGVMTRGQLNYWRVKPETVKLVEAAAKKLIRNPQEMPGKPVGGFPKCLGKPLPA